MNKNTIFKAVIIAAALLLVVCSFMGVPISFKTFFVLMMLTIFMLGVVLLI